MLSNHANSQFPVFGTEVEKLYNSRYKITVRCTVEDKTRAWYYSQVPYFFKEYGDLYSLALNVDTGSDGWTVETGEEYPNMRLVSTDFGYIPSQPEPVLTFVYETLTSSFVQEAEDSIEISENGLRIVKRTLIAIAGSTYNKIPGVETISHTSNGNDLLTLKLASVSEYQKKSNEGGFDRFIEAWIEPGIVAVTFEYTEGSTRVIAESVGLSDNEVENSVGAVTVNHKLISKKESDYQGLVSKISTYQVDSFDVVQQEENGLLQLTRTSLSTSPYTAGNIGTDTITYSGTTLYLVGEEIDNGNSIKRRTSKWMEPGLVRKSENNGPGELITTEWEFIGEETAGVVVGTKVSIETGNFEGFQTLVIKTVNAPDGTDILSGGADKQIGNTYQKLIDWTRPGIVGIREEDITGGLGATSVSLYQRSPAEVKVRANIAVYMSASPTITDADLATITGVLGIQLWNVPEWATFDGRPSAGSPVAVNRVTFSKTMRGFRAIANGDANFGGDISTSGSAKVGNSLLLWYYPSWFGDYIQYDGTAGEVLATASIEGGPPRPEGSSWVLDIDNQPLLTDIDGNKYYRKVFVWAYIPDWDNAEDVFTDPV